MLGGRFRWTAGVIALSCVPGTEARGDVRSFAAVADTYVSSAAPAKNFGRSATLEIARRPTERAYLRFNVTLPTDAAISGATLTVVTRAARGTAVYRAFAVSNNAWKETAISFHNAPPLGVRLGAARHGSVKLAAGSVNPGPTSIALAASGGAAQRLRSREGGRAPRLRVTYVRGGPGKVILAAGDIQRTGTTDNATVSLLESNPFDALLPLGDNRYERGALPDYNAFYSQTWGQARFKARTYPVPGNHEGTTRLSSDYCSYFQSGDNGPAAVDPCPGGRPYYSYQLGAWHMIALNSASGTIDDAQRAWLRADLAAHPSRCALA